MARQLFASRTPMKVWLILGGAALLFGLQPQEVHAAEFTDLLDAADDFDDLDEETWDPFDFNLEPSFRFDYSTASISREAPCTPGDPFGDRPDSDLNESELRIRNNPRLETDEARCSEPSTVYNKEMLFKGTRAQLDLKARFGIYKDLELHVNVPYVFAQTRQLTHDNTSANASQNVSGANSSVDPNLTCDPGQAGRCVEREAGNVFEQGQTTQQQIDSLDLFNAYRYFDLASENTYTRTGFAEPTVGLHWAMFNDHRDPTKATMLLGVDYTMPIVPIAQRGNNAVGRGMHQLDFSLASSKQFNWIEPYFGIQYSLPLASPNSPIQEIDVNNRGQVFTNPPMSGQFSVGTEFIPYENLEKGQRYGLDLRFTFGYVSEGRDYTPMFDHFVNSGCNGKTIAEVLPQFDSSGNITILEDVACSWVVRQPSNSDGPRPVYDLAQAVEDGNSDQFYSDGIMTVEGYGTFRGDFGFYLQPSPYFQLKGQVALEHRQEHFISNARTGRDAANASEVDADDTVDLEGADAAIERNPVYNPSYDSSGERFRVQAYNTWQFMLTAALQF